MGLQKYRADIKGEPDANGATPWYAKWVGGPSLAKIEACPIDGGLIPPRTVYVRGEPDTFFSQPAACRYRNRTVRGWLGCEDGKWLFHPDRDHLEWLMQRTI